MAGFGIATERTKGRIEEFNRYSELLADYTDQIRNLSTCVGPLGWSTERIRAVLYTASMRVESEQSTAKNMGANLAQIIALYELTEKKICDQASGSMTVQNPEDAPAAPAEKDTDADVPENDDGIWDFLLDALKQAVMGDFYTDDGNWLGVALSVGIGFIPYVGQIADVRDLVADIYNLIDDGPTTEEWVSLGFTVVGIIPGVGDFLKHGDEAGDAVKGLLRNFDHADEAADAVKNFFRKGDDVFTAIGNKIDDFNDLFQRNVLDRVDNLIDSHTISRTVKDTVNHVTDTVRNNRIVQSVDSFLNRLDYTRGNLEISAKKFIEGMVDEYKGDLEENTLTKLLDWIGGKPQEEPAT